MDKILVHGGHTLSGDFRFGVGVSPGAGAEGGTNDEPTGSGILIAVGRLLEDTSLLLLLVRGVSHLQPDMSLTYKAAVPVALFAAFAGFTVTLVRAVRGQILTK